MDEHPIRANATDVMKERSCTTQKTDQKENTYKMLYVRTRRTSPLVSKVKTEAAWQAGVGRTAQDRHVTRYAACRL